ncbi:MAG: sigma-70 family RNA polymerase sigma factor [Pseudomonadota bacterium]
MAEDLPTLIYRTALGDQRAFELLYQATSPQLYALAIAVLRNRDLAQDTLQEAFISIWHAAGSYNASKGSVQTWLNVIVRHRCIDRLRRLPRNETHFNDAEWANLEADGPTPLQHLVKDADARGLARCLSGLDGQQRDALTLAYFHGLTHSELATHLKAPLGSIKSRVRRGLSSLRRCLHHEA